MAIPYFSVQPGSTSNGFIDDQRPKFWISHTGVRFCAEGAGCFQLFNLIGGYSDGTDNCPSLPNEICTSYHSARKTVDQCYLTSYVFPHSYQCGPSLCIDRLGNGVTGQGPGTAYYIGDKCLCTCDGTQIKYAYYSQDTCPSCALLSCPQFTYIGTDGSIRLTCIPCDTKYANCVGLGDDSPSTFFGCSFTQTTCTITRTHRRFHNVTDKVLSFCALSCLGNAVNELCIKQGGSSIPFWCGLINGCTGEVFGGSSIEIHYNCNDSNPGQCDFFGTAANIDYTNNEYNVFHGRRKTCCSSQCDVFGHIFVGCLFDADISCNTRCNGLKKIVPLPRTGTLFQYNDAMQIRAQYNQLDIYDDQYITLTGATPGQRSKCGSAIPFPVIYDRCNSTIRQFIGQTFNNSCFECNQRLFVHPGIIGVTPRDTIVAAHHGCSGIFVYEFCNDYSDISGGCYSVIDPVNVLSTTCTTAQQFGDFSEAIYDYDEDKIIFSVYSRASSVLCSETMQVQTVLAIPSDTTKVNDFISINCDCDCADKYMVYGLNPGASFTDSGLCFNAAACTDPYACWTALTCICTDDILCSTVGCCQGFISDCCIADAVSSTPNLFDFDINCVTFCTAAFSACGIKFREGGLTSRITGDSRNPLQQATADFTDVCGANALPRQRSVDYFPFEE